MTFLSKHIPSPGGIGKILASEFRKILIFEYNDGIEKCFIETTDESYIYIEAIDDSKSRLFKAYRMIDISSDFKYIFDIEFDSIASGNFIHASHFDDYNFSFFNYIKKIDNIYYGLSKISFEIFEYFYDSDNEITEPNFHKVHVAIKKKRG